MQDCQDEETQTDAGSGAHHTHGAAIRASHSSALAAPRRSAASKPAEPLKRPALRVAQSETPSAVVPAPETTAAETPASVPLADAGTQPAAVFSADNTAEDIPPEDKADELEQPEQNHKVAGAEIDAMEMQDAHLEKSAEVESAAMADASSTAEVAMRDDEEAAIGAAVATFENGAGEAEEVRRTQHQQIPGLPP